MSRRAAPGQEHARGPTSPSARRDDAGTRAAASARAWAWARKQQAVPAHPSPPSNPPPLHCPQPSGRKLGALLYVATYAASCATKHSSAYSVLLAGRLLGGVSTSLLFSVFEAWAVAAHAARGLDETLLVRTHPWPLQCAVCSWGVQLPALQLPGRGRLPHKRHLARTAPCCRPSPLHLTPSPQQADLFTKAVMLGNGVMAIASGLVGSWLVQGLGLGPVAPFDAAILVRVATGGSARRACTHTAAASDMCLHR